MRTEGRPPYDSVDDMVDESATLLMRERAVGDRNRRTWVLPSEVAFYTGLDEQVVMAAMRRLDERSAGAQHVNARRPTPPAPDPEN